MSTQTESAYQGANDDDTAFGLAANLAAALSYVFAPLVGIIVLVVEEDNEFLRFHAAQSVAAGAGLMVVWFGLSIFMVLLPAVIAGLLSLVLGLVSMGIFVAFLFLAYKAYSEETIELPVLADVAKSIEESI